MKKFIFRLMLIILSISWANNASHAQVDSAHIHNKGYGVKSIDTKEKVNEHTQFQIASNSKAFTATALSILVDEGKLSWQDRVKDHIPEFKMYNTYVTENFNLQDLLTHRSGLGLGAGDLMFFPDGSNFTIQDVVSIFQHFEPQSAFRTKYDYDNILYMVAGEVIARVSGMSWEDFIKTRIMEPLRMDYSFSSLAYITDRSNVATPHVSEMGEFRTIAHFQQDPKKINGAAGGILSNVDDLCNWLLVHLNKGKYDENLKNELFSETNHKEMWKIHTPLKFKPNPRYNTHFAGYGLGWGLLDVKGNMKITHGGGLPGMLSLTTLIPDLNLGVVVLTNTSTTNGEGRFCYSIIQTIIDSYMGLDDHGWVEKSYDRIKKSQSTADSVTTLVWQTVRSTTDDHIKVENFVGIYEDKWFGQIEIFQDDGQLWFKSYRSPKLTGPMSYYKANAFVIKWNYTDWNADAFAIFNLDEEGIAQSIRMKGISPNIDFSFDFQDLDLRRVIASESRE